MPEPFEDRNMNFLIEYLLPKIERGIPKSEKRIFRRPIYSIFGL